MKRIEISINFLPNLFFFEHIYYVFFFMDQHGKYNWEEKMGGVSILSEATENLPTPFDNFTTLKTRFGALGINVKDLVVLSGKIHFDLRHIVT